MSAVDHTILRVVQRLALGVVLISACAAVLLLSDWHGRVTRRAAVPRVAVFAFSNQGVMEESVRGCLEALAARGYRADETMQLQQFSAESDLPTANTIAKGIVDAQVNVAITFGTPCLQAMAASNRDGQVPHVFGCVTDPYTAGVGLDRARPKLRPPWLTGLGTFEPVREAFQLARQLRPALQCVGVVWCTSESCSEACLRVARDECRLLGITLLEAPITISIEVPDAAKSLVARGAEALWLGGDNIVEVAAPALIEVGRVAQIPVFANVPWHAANGALFGLGADFVEAGRITGNIAADVLDGRAVAEMPIREGVPQQLALNTSVPATLRDVWRIPSNVLATAATVIDGTNSVKAPASSVPQAGATNAPKCWNIHFLNYAESSLLDECLQGFHAELAARGMVTGRHCRITLRNAQCQMLNLVTMVDAAVADNADLILVTSTPTLQATLKKAGQVPVLFTVVANPFLAGVGTDVSNHLPTVTGISTMSDFADMAAVVRECLPHATRVGTLFSSNEDNCVYNKDMLAAALQKVGISLDAVAVSTSAEVADAALALSGRGIDAICQVVGNMLDTSFAAITLTARRERLPLFAFATSQARDGGAAVTVARDYAEAGRQLARQTQRVMQGALPAQMPIEYVSTTVLSVHPSNAAACGLVLPSQLCARAANVFGVAGEPHAAH
ncbi:MAG: ABC transporter substrate-binding protein [bacterium]|nr:ABC transporter substrate-binding protein [bacterium]